MTSAATKSDLRRQRIDARVAVRLARAQAAQAAETARPPAAAPDKPAMERRVYLLPAAMVSAILDHQVKRGLASEAAAVRDLLTSALAREDG